MSDKSGLFGKKPLGLPLPPPSDLLKRLNQSNKEEELAKLAAEKKKRFREALIKERQLELERVKSPDSRENRLKQQQQLAEQRRKQRELIKQKMIAARQAKIQQRLKAIGEIKRQKEQLVQKKKADREARIQVKKKAIEYKKKQYALQLQQMQDLKKQKFRESLIRERQRELARKMPSPPNKAATQQNTKLPISIPGTKQPVFNLIEERKRRKEAILREREEKRKAVLTAIQKKNLAIKQLQAKKIQERKQQLMAKLQEKERKKRFQERQRLEARQKVLSAKKEHNEQNLRNKLAAQSNKINDSFRKKDITVLGIRLRKNIRGIEHHKRLAVTPTALLIGLSKDALLNIREDIKPTKVLKEELAHIHKKLCYYEQLLFQNKSYLIADLEKTRELYYDYEEKAETVRNAILTKLVDISREKARIRRQKVKQESDRLKNIDDERKVREKDITERQRLLQHQKEEAERLREQQEDAKRKALALKEKEAVEKKKQQEQAWRKVQEEKAAKLLAAQKERQKILQEKEKMQQEKLKQIILLKQQKAAERQKLLSEAQKQKELKIQQAESKKQKLQADKLAKTKQQKYTPQTVVQSPLSPRKSKEIPSLPPLLPTQPSKLKPESLKISSDIKPRPPPVPFFRFQQMEKIKKEREERLKKKLAAIKVAQQVREKELKEREKLAAQREKEAFNKKKEIEKKKIQAQQQKEKEFKLKQLLREKQIQQKKLEKERIIQERQKKQEEAEAEKLRIKQEKEKANKQKQELKLQQQLQKSLERRKQLEARKKIPEDDLSLPLPPVKKGLLSRAEPRVEVSDLDGELKLDFPPKKKQRVIPKNKLPDIADSLVSEMKPLSLEREFKNKSEERQRLLDQKEQLRLEKLKRQELIKQEREAARQAKIAEKQRLLEQKKGEYQARRRAINLKKMQVEQSKVPPLLRIKQMTAETAATPEDELQISEAINKARQPTKKMDSINERIFKARDALLAFEFSKAKSLYLELLRLYNSLPNSEKGKYFESIQELYEERKSAEKLFQRR
ncbi:MAG TPA: hypothetical protein VJH97_07560 [Candidatus Nanoarchaeia archaeon]|nr:hypothetical protein [Candidatus Nanoarchaeia archaeon]